MARKLRIAFYQVHMPSRSGLDFEAAMEGFSSLPVASPDRVIPVGSKYVRLHQLERHGTFYCGELVGIRMDVTPKRAGLHGGVTPIEFAESEGLGEETAFLYDPAHRVLVMERNRNAVSPSALIGYVERFPGVNGEIGLLPIPSKGTLERLERLQHIATFDLGFAGHLRLDREAGASRSVGQLMSMAEELNAPQVRFRVSVGRQWRTRSLNRPLIQELVQFLLPGGGAEHLDRLIVTGRNEDDEGDVIDLLAERIADEVEVDADEGRSVSYVRRRAALVESYQRKSEELATVLQG